MRKGLKNVAPNGIIGDPRGSTAEAGKAINKKLAEAIVKLIQSDSNG